MGTRARVVVLPGGSKTLQVEDVTLPDPGPMQVVVKQFASGICHSQLHELHRPAAGAADAGTREHGGGAPGGRGGEPRGGGGHGAGDLGPAQHRGGGRTPHQ